jgi:hypothetical protein
MIVKEKLRQQFPLLNEQDLNEERHVLHLVDIWKGEMNTQ